jgi:NADH-quinone oxidoreductase subunit N
MDNQIKGVDYALTALIAIATVYIVFTNDLAMILLAFVISSIPTYVLIMTSESNAKVDVAIKYITFMVLATVLFIAGAVIMVYANSVDASHLFSLGFVMLIVGLGMEVGCAPMHEWVPDVFDTAHPIPVSIVASIAKIVPFVATYKILIMTANPLLTKLVMFVAFISAISMFVGNVGALTTNNPARILAYSTVANMGYVLATLVVLIDLNWIYLAFAGALLQLMANAFGKIGFFVSMKEDGASNYLMYTLAFSFIGMPPLIGFWGKLFILLSLVKVGYIWLALILVINSAISVPYYVRLARILGKPAVPSMVNAIALIAVALTFITIVPPNWFIDLAKAIIGGV